jgi:hypothetical protein
MSKEENLGHNFGKSDLSRMGLFSEQRYISVGEKYVSKKGGKRVLKSIFIGFSSKWQTIYDSS